MDLLHQPLPHAWQACSSDQPLAVTQRNVTPLSQHPGEAAALQRDRFGARGVVRAIVDLLRTVRQTKEPFLGTHEVKPETCCRSE